MAEEHVVEKRNQRRTQAANCQVRRAKIGDYGHAGASGDYRGLAGLPSAGNFTSEEDGGLALVIKGLAVASDEINLREACGAQGLEHGFGVELTQQKIEPGEIG